MKYSASACVFPLTTAGSTKVFTALLERCQARKMIALVRLVVRQRTSVALAALIPQKEVLDETNAQTLPPGFLVYHLPFAGESLFIIT